MEVYFYSVSKIDDRGKGGSEKDLVEIALEIRILNKKYR